MAIFDPTQQINQLGQQAVQGVQNAGNQFVGQRQQQIDYTQRMMDNISAIRDEAEIMHQDYMQDEIDATLSDLSSEIFKQRKNGQTEIDYKGFAGLNKKISRLKNMASNSKRSAQLFDQTSKLALNDPYVMNKPQVFQALTSMVADPKYLEKNPADLESAMSEVYMGSVDRVAQIGDLVKKDFGTTKQSFTTRDEKTGERSKTSFEVVNGVMDTRGNITPEGIQLIKDEAAKAGYQFSDEEAAMVGNRLSSQIHTERDFGDTERALDQKDESLELQRLRIFNSGKKDESVETKIPMAIIDGLSFDSPTIDPKKIEAANAARRALSGEGVMVDRVKGEDVIKIREDKSYRPSDLMKTQKKLYNDFTNMDVDGIDPKKNYIIINGQLIEATPDNDSEIDFAIFSALNDKTGEADWNRLNKKFNSYYDSVGTEEEKEEEVVTEATSEEKEEENKEPAKKKIVWTSKTN